MENNNNNNVIAPFVMKTYQMVNDPMTDMLISWSRANNSFIIIDPLDFSQRILPVYFKHNNFSSFVRQLNTYGFRKVDPDKWEFANEWFLRGQKQLLKNIIRRKQSSKSNQYTKIEEIGDDELVMEIARLKQEQRSLEEELQGMNKRLEATERRPQQMMAFLYKVIEDPDLLPRMVLEKERTDKLAATGDKKRRLMMVPTSRPSSSSSMSTVSSSIKSEDEEERTVGGVLSTSSSDSGLEISQSSPSPENSVSATWGHMNYGCGGISPTVTAAVTTGQGNGGQMGYFGELVGGVESSPPPPYPFSLLGGGF